MKELISEQQADRIILLLSLMVTLGSLAAGAFFRSRFPSHAKAVWAQAAVAALVGPAIWAFWTFLYNPIEDHYGLDSVKALKINFFIALGLGALFLVLHVLALRWAGPLPAAKAPKGR